MYTAEDARKGDMEKLDRRIQEAVEDSKSNSAYLRIYVEDPWYRTIEAELTKRGFKNIQVPDIVLAGDVYFEWGDE